MSPLRLPTPARWSALALGACTLLAAAPAFADVGTTACPGSPSRPPRDPSSPLPTPWPPRVPESPDPDPGTDGALAARLAQAMAPLELLPGTQRVTAGEPLSAHLNGPQVLGETVAFSFLALDNTVVSGTLQQQVINADDHTCDYYWTIHVDSGSSHAIDRLTISGYTHPKHLLYGDYRNDLVPGGTPSDHVKRSSGSGSTITFRIDAGVSPSATSRPLLLDSGVGSTHKTGTVRLRATDGSLSAPIPAWVPVWP